MAERRGKADPDEIGHGQILGFAVGEFGIHIPFLTVILFLFFFYTEAVGLSAAVAGTMFMIASIWDGITDPVMGVIADRTNTRWGKYRPYMLWGALPLGLSFAFVFYEPALEGFLLVAFLTGSHILFRTCFTAVAIPYGSLTARMTTNSRTRSTISGYKLFFTIASASLAAYLVFPLLAAFGEHGQSRAFFFAACLLGVAPLIFLPIVFVSTREKQLASDVAGAQYTLRESLVTLWTNRAYRIVLICIICTISSQVGFNSSILYYFKYYLGNEQAAQIALAAGSASTLLILPVWVVVERAIGKRNAWLVASPTALAALAIFYLFEFDTALSFTILSLVFNLALYCMTMTMWSMLPDTIEYGHHLSGRRVESLTFGFSTFVLKVAMGVGTAVFGILLDSVGFIANQDQTPETLAGMKAIMVFWPAPLVLMSLLAMLYYPMRPGDHERIVTQLEGRAARI